MTLDKAEATSWLRAQKGKVRETHSLAMDREQAAAIEVEAWLQRHDVKYAPATWIPMGMIDVKKSRGNQAREEALVPESVERFATSLRADGVFPPIVCYPVGLSKVAIIDGNNRQAAAAKVGRDSIWGIVIDERTPGDLIQLLTVEANASHGVTPPLEWRIKQAFYLCSIGFPDPKVAHAAGISLSQLQTARAVREADERAASMKIHNFDELVATTKTVLNAVRDDPVFYQASRIAIGTKMNIADVRDMTRTLKSLKSEAEKIAFLGELARERELEEATRRVHGKTIRGVTSPQHSLSAGLGQVTAVKPDALVRQIVTTRDREVLTKRVEEALNHLLEIQVALDALKIEEES